MKVEDIRKLTVEETADSLKLTIRYEELDITKMATRRLQNCVLGKDKVVEDQANGGTNLVEVFDDYRESESTLQINIEGDFCYIITNTYGRDVVSDIENIFSYSSTFLIDDAFNHRLMDFLQNRFPDHFERKYAHENLLLDYKNGLLDGYVMSGDFYLPDESPESFYPALLMLTAYGFPALYPHYADTTRSGHVLGVFSDFKLTYEPFMSAPTEAILADIAFMNRRKLFRRISPNMSVAELSLVHQLADIVPVDDLEFVMRELDFNNERSNVEAWYSHISVLSNFSPSVRRRLVRSIFDGGNLIEDAFDMVNRYATDYSFFKGVRTVDELHDRAMSLIPEITDDRYLSRVPEDIALNQVIEVPETNMKLVLLINHMEFIRTGRDLNTCIGSVSYFEKSLNGESYCYQIFDDDKLIGALEIGAHRSAFKVIQCTGFKNAKLEFEDVIFGALRKSLKQMSEQISTAQ